MQVTFWKQPLLAAAAFVGSMAMASAAAAHGDALPWRDDYFAAYAEAEAQQKPLLLYFTSASEAQACTAFEHDTLTAAEVAPLLERCVRVRLPGAATVTVDGVETQLLRHGAFAEMLGRPGLALIDLAHRDAPYYGRVVSVLPFSPGNYTSAFGLATLLQLPPGTLTQRTLTYAVRVHPEAPQSTQGELLPVLAAEAEAAAAYQASIQVQGHHDWNARFQRINGELPAGHLAQEVCAESWPGQTMLESAQELVHSWRQSAGHWEAVSRAQPFFGYDMKQGGNGVWYGVGVFGN